MQGQRPPAQHCLLLHLSCRPEDLEDCKLCSLPLLLKCQTSLDHSWHKQDDTHHQLNCVICMQVEDQLLDIAIPSEPHPNAACRAGSGRHDWLFQGYEVRHLHVGRCRSLLAAGSALGG